MHILDPEGKVLEVSDSFCQMLGYSRSELIGANASMWDAQWSPQELKQLIAQQIAKEGRSILETRHRRRNGSFLDVEITGQGLELDGKPVLFNSARDITERKLTQEKQRAAALFARRLIESSLDPLVTISPEGKITDANRMTEEITGIARTELIGTDFGDCFTEPEQGRAGYLQVLAQGFVRDYPLTVRHRDGHTTDVLYNATVYRDEAGDVQGVFAAARDITERKQAERLVRDSEKRFRAIFDQAPIAMALVDRQGHPTISNSPLSKMVGYSNDELSKMKFSDFTYPEDVDKNLNQFAELLQGKISMYSMEKRYVHKNGNLIWANLFVTILRDENGFPQEVIGMAEDITARKRAEETRALRETELEESQRIARIGSWEWTRDTGVAAWSDGMNHVLARDRALPAPGVEALPQFFTPESWRQLRAAGARAFETGASYDLELEMIRADGATCWTTTRGEAIRGADGTVVKLRGTVLDITERKKTEARIAYLNRVYAVLSGIDSLIVRVRDRDELFREACRVAVEEGGFRMSLISIVDRNAMKIVPVASAGKDDELLHAIKGVLSSSEGAPTTMVARAISEKKTIVANDSQNDPRVLFGKKYAESGVRSMVVLPLIVSDVAIGALALYSSEIDFFQEEELKLLTELAGDIAFAMDHIEKQEQLDYLAYYDVLTGLANRALFLERVAQYIRSAASGGHRLAVGLIDLERFKNINDSLGRPAGDALLRQVAEWLTRNLGDANLLARIDADHFAAVLPDVMEEGDVARFVEKSVKGFLDHPFRLDDAVFRIAARVGVALFPDDGADADTLFKHAEAALKKAKASGERYLFYTQTMTETVAGKLTLENQLRQALDKGEFVLHYQAKVNLVSGKLTGAEALIRWNDPRTGLVPPGCFIPILEETGLIYEVGRWALRKAIEDYLRWRAAGLAAVRIAVNVSPLQLRNRGFIAEIGQAIGIDAHAAAGLELEITESLIMEDVKHNIASLQAIRALGVTIAIDDFGTGFSSLSYLAKLPVDTLKIDRSFVLDMTASAEGLALVQTIISLAHALKLKVVAEGVETEEQSRLLRLLNCDEMQGFLFSKPLPREIFETRYLAPSPAA